ncbi:MAG: HD domain-containing protein, partial [Verrucomicrobia bacterium]|nr:HD domain-containing protein [Verrucomicrobiota bacterium]
MLAIAAYLLVSTATASQDAPSWLSPLVLLLASLAFADLRLQVGKFQTQVPLSELLVVSVLPAASPLMGGFFALCATGGRAVLEQKTNRDWTEFSIKLAASGLAAISGLALAGSVAGGATGTFGLIMLALWYLASVSAAESITVGLWHWRRHLASNLRKALLGAAAFAPVVFVLVKATEPQANPMVWICFPILISVYWYIDVRYGEMVVDLRRADELHELYAPAVQALAIAMDAKDSVSSDHVKRVQKYCIEVGKALNCSAAELQALEFGALLHDIGKIAIPDIVLTKPGRLSPEEFSQMA